MDAPNLTSSVASASNLSFGKKVAFTAIVVIGFFLMAEILARWTVAPPESPNHKTHRRIIDVLGLPALNETMEYDSDRFWRLKSNLENFRVHGSLDAQPIDFTLNTFDHLRWPPVGPKGAPTRILALGDSCAFGLGVGDADTWPAQLQTELRERNADIEVVNAGTPGYTAFQGLQLLKTQGESLAPDWVIVAFGFNDTDIWGDRSDIQMARTLKRADWEEWLAASRLFDAMRRLIRYGSLASYDPENDPLDEHPERLKKAVTEGKLRQRLSAEEFAGIYEQIDGWCKARGCKTLFLIWPYREQFEARQTQLYYYQIVIDEVSRKLNVPLVNLVPPFNAQRRSLYLDSIHANRLGNETAAKAIANTLGPLIKSGKR